MLQSWYLRRKNLEMRKISRNAQEQARPESRERNLALAVIERALKDTYNPTVPAQWKEDALEFFADEESLSAWVDAADLDFECVQRELKARGLR